MGDQGASCDGMRTMREWFEAALSAIYKPFTTDQLAGMAAGHSLAR